MDSLNQATDATILIDRELPNSQNLQAIENISVQQVNASAAGGGSLEHNNRGEGITEVFSLPPQQNVQSAELALAGNALAQSEVNPASAQANALPMMADMAISSHEPLNNQELHGMSSFIH